MVVQWLELGAFTAVGPGLIPRRRTKIPKDAWHSQKTNKKITKKPTLKTHYILLFLFKVLVFLSFRFRIRGDSAGKKLQKATRKIATVF